MSITHILTWGEVGVEPRNRHGQQVATAPLRGPLGLTLSPLYQLALSSDLWHDPLLKINFNLFLPCLSPPKNSRQHYQPLMEVCLLFYSFFRKLRVTGRGIIFRENWVPSVSQHYSFNNFYRHTRCERASPRDVPCGSWKI